MDSPPVYQQAPATAGREIGGLAVVFHTGQKMMRQLNPAASVIWSVFETPQPASAAVEAVRRHFDVGVARAEADVAHFVRECVARELLVEQAPR